MDGVTTVDPVFIPLRDGTRLAARLWLPAVAPGGSVPTILEALPYRRNDGTFLIDQPRYTWWAAQGFAGVRVDLRGTGDSDGLLHDEYLALEQDDALEVMEWIAAQSWSNGRVGLVGFSWGGFAALQIAARRPPQLGAIVTVNSVVRRYTDDCHYTGGLVNGHDMLSWATTMYAYDARPPDPLVVGERWREMWFDRINAVTPMIEPWLNHQLEDEYWQHGSVHFDYDALDVPILAVGGWADPYRNAVLDLLDNRPDLTSGIIGPWAHGYPQATDPGPRIDFLGEVASFFGEHLRGDAASEGCAPGHLRAYIQDADDPRSTDRRNRPGQWMSVDRSPDVRRRPMPVPPLTGATSDETTPPALATPSTAATPSSATMPSVARAWLHVPAEPGRVRSDERCGANSGTWCPYGATALPTEQSHDDARSLVTDSDALTAAVSILGFPVVALRLAADRPRALIAVRLCDVAPDGTSLLVTRGVLNLTHRNGHDRVEAIVPGEPMGVAVRLDAAGHRFAAGHRIRIALSATYWPWVWPSPEPVTLHISAATMHLPLLDDDARPTAFAGPRSGDRAIVERIAHTAAPDENSSDHAAGRQPDFLSGRIRFPELDIETEESGFNRTPIIAGDPLSARAEIRRSVALAREGWDTHVDVDSVMTCTATTFAVTTTLVAREHGAAVLRREHHIEIPRFGE
jgi:uncharacterized protein